MPWERFRLAGEDHAPEPVDESGGSAEPSTTRKVGRAGKISFASELYEVGVWLDGETVDVAVIDGLVQLGAPRSAPTSSRSRSVMIPDLDLARVRRWIDGRNADMPPDVRDQIRYEIDDSDRAIAVFECSPPWRQDFGPEWTRFPICRFRYTKVRQEWSLYWRDRHLKSMSTIWSSRARTSTN